MKKGTVYIKRVYFMILLMITLFLVLIFRLFSIQIKDTRDFSSHHVDLILNSTNQKTQELLVSNGRGRILDRNLEELVEQEKIVAIGIFPFVKNNIDTKEINSLANIIGISDVELKNQLDMAVEPTFIMKNNEPIGVTEAQQKRIDDLHIFGVVTTDYVRQQYDNVFAKHAIGYLSQAPEDIYTMYQESLDKGILFEDSKIGRSGLQKTFQNTLQALEKKIVYFVDRKGNPLEGLDPNSKKVDKVYPFSVVTTIDKEIQVLAEQQLSKFGIKEGSIVVLDTENGDILTMANAPDFDLENIDPFSTDWNNKSVKITEPGSIFKTLIAIAALEEGISINEEFYCNGSYHNMLSCHKKHGKQTLEEGYINSCNVVFAEVAERLGMDLIEDYANQLGLIGKIGWTDEFLEDINFSQIANEEENRITHKNTNKSDTGALIRTAIGQQDVRISPLAATNFIVTILNNGKVFEPRLVKKVIYADGRDYFDFDIQKKETNIASIKTYSLVRKMMEGVVDKGTGKYLKNAKWSLAGKSGTAENNKHLDNQWFIGYGPTERPRYAVTVLVKNVSTNQLIAQQIFKGLMDGLAERAEK